MASTPPSLFAATSSTNNNKSDNTTCPTISGISSRIRLPASFVILQGIPGDGRANTLDRLPKLHRRGWSATDEQNDDEPRINDGHSGMDGEISITHERVVSADTDVDDSNQDYIVIQDESSSNCSQLGNAAQSHDAAGDEQDQPTESRLDTFEANGSWIHASDDEEEAIQDTSSKTPSPLSLSVSSSDQPAVSDETALPPDEQQQSSPDLSNVATTEQSEIDKNILDDWQADCRQYEQYHRDEWLQAARQHQRNQMALGLANAAALLSTEEGLWWQCPQTNQLAVFADLPTHHNMVMISSLAPGTTVIGTELVVLDSSTLLPLPVEALGSEDDSNGQVCHSYQTGRLGWILVLKIESTCVGYIVLSHNGYPTAMAGLPLQFCQPTQWLWMVTCPAGAVVRDGLDLSSPQLALLPYGTVVEVTCKVINAMGLSRLQVRVVYAAHTEISQQKATNNLLRHDILPLSLSFATHEATIEPSMLEGWCSEYLNPLSGQSGPVLQALPFPCPVRYQVVLEQGAVLRSGVELSSPQIGHVPCGATVTIIGRKFSDHPRDRCVERLQLAGNGGWMSCRLNKRQPEDLVVVECNGLDSSFDANCAGQYHLCEMRRVQQEQHQRTIEAAASILPSSAMAGDDNKGNGPTPATIYSSSANTRFNGESDGRQDNRCLLCLDDVQSATFVHGETGHIACCLLCARIMKARSEPCPVCRLPIDLVIQHFYA